MYLITAPIEDVHILYIKYHVCYKKFNMPFDRICSFQILFLPELNVPGF